MPVMLISADRRAVMLSRAIAIAVPTFDVRVIPSMTKHGKPEPMSSSIRYCLLTLATLLQSILIAVLPTVTCSTTRRLGLKEDQPSCDEHSTWHNPKR